MKYPLGENERSTITSKTGKHLDDITLEAVKRGEISGDDIKISKEMLRKQGQVAKEADSPAMEKNFERAAELVDVPDDVILTMYNMLRPNRPPRHSCLIWRLSLRANTAPEAVPKWYARQRKFTRKEEFFCEIDCRC